jgi:hypothetical protein
MTIRSLAKNIPQLAVVFTRRVVAGAVACLFVGASMTACAAEPLYNPDNLQAPEFTRITDICQGVMGLSPKEPMVGGYWPGEPRLDYYTNKYRVCIVSLSDSLRGAADTQVTRAADAQCRAKGYADHSSDLALCVLETSNRQPDPLAASLVTRTASVIGSAPPLGASSYYYASPHVNARREQVACAAIGMEPTEPAFSECVERINHALNSLDNPIT